MISRRDFVKYLGLAGVTAAVSETMYAQLASADSSVPQPSPANYVPTNLGITGNIVVVGGGMSGAACAKYLRIWGGTGVKVTLVDKFATYTSNIKSNDVLTGQLALSALQVGYTNLATLGVKFVQATATSVDTVGRTVTLSTGAKLPYDRLVLGSGVVFDALPGMASASLYDTTIPHAWQAGPQTNLLRTQLVNMRAGGTYVQTVPIGPYRCCPGPYERACLVADWLNKNKPGSKVVLLDANPDIQSEKPAFNYAFTTLYPNTIKYVTNAPVQNVNVAAKTVTAGGVTYPYDVFNPIPVHRAGLIAQSIPGLVDTPGFDSPTPRWASVNFVTYESTKVAKVHVIGDSAYTVPQPKSGHMANSEGKVAAAAIVALLSAKTPDPAPVTSSACYSPLTMSTASWLTGVYHYDPATKMVQVKSGMATRYTSDNYTEAAKWWAALMTDTFK